MAWELRGGSRYYYRKVRRGGRVFSVYEGGGLAGALSAARDEAARQERAQSRESLRRAAQEDRVDELVDRSWLVAEGAARALLEAAGYHKHKGQWRLKRNADG